MNKSLATRCFVALAALSASGGAHAYVVNIGHGSETVYLRVGDGVFNGTYANNGTPQSGGAISRVSVSVPQASVGNGTAQAMTANSRTTSDWDGYQFCNAGQLYVGGFYRRPNNGNFSATLSVTSPANLTNEYGDTIPISQLSWTSSGNGDGAATQPVGANFLAPGIKTLAADFRRNTWRESCLSFNYANAAVVAGGTYTARITFTLTAP